MRCREVRGLNFSSPSFVTESIRGLRQSHQLNVGTSFKYAMTNSLYTVSRLTTDASLPMQLQILACAAETECESDIPKLVKQLLAPQLPKHVHVQM
jgi:hypothetical protein